MFPLEYQTGQSVNGTQHQCGKKHCPEIAQPSSPFLCPFYLLENMKINSSYLQSVSFSLTPPPPSPRKKEKRIRINKYIYKNSVRHTPVYLERYVLITNSKQQKEIRPPYNYTPPTTTSTTNHHNWVWVWGVVVEMKMTFCECVLPLQEDTDVELWRSSISQRKPGPYPPSPTSQDPPAR